MQIKRFLNRAVFFAGWILSPFTTWNDAFVNIPISYLLANIYIKAIRGDFFTMVLVFYWLTNGLGILLMLVAGKREILAEKGLKNGLINLIATITIYSIILFILNRVGILRPIFK